MVFKWASVDWLCLGKFLGWFSFLFPSGRCYHYTGWHSHGHGLDWSLGFAIYTRFTLGLWPSDDQNRVTPPFCVLVLMPVQSMNKTLWFVQDDVYTSLQLLEWVVGVEDCFWWFWFACPSPPCKLVNLGLVQWWSWTGWTALAVLPVLGVLTLWRCCRWNG
jgi:hypothetical protein